MRGLFISIAQNRKVVYVYTLDYRYSVGQSLGSSEGNRPSCSIVKSPSDRNITQIIWRPKEGLDLSIKTIDDNPNEYFKSLVEGTKLLEYFVEFGKTTLVVISRHPNDRLAILLARDCESLQPQEVSDTLIIKFLHLRDIKYTRMIFKDQESENDTEFGNQVSDKIYYHAYRPHVMPMNNNNRYHNYNHNQNQRYHKNNNRNREEESDVINNDEDGNNNDTDNNNNNNNNNRNSGKNNNEHRYYERYNRRYNKPFYKKNIQPNSEEVEEEDDKEQQQQKQETKKDIVKSENNNNNNNS